MLKPTLNPELSFIWKDLMNDKARRLAFESMAFAVFGSLLIIAAPYGISIFIDGLSQGTLDLLVVGGIVFLTMRLIEVFAGFFQQRHREYFFQEEFWYLPQSVMSLSLRRPLAFLTNSSSDIDGGGITSLREKTWGVIGTFVFAIIPIFSQSAFALGACFFAHPLIGLGALLYAITELKLGKMNNHFIQTEMRPVIDMFKRWERRMSEWGHNLDHIKYQGVETKILGFIHGEVQEALQGDDRVWRGYYAYWVLFRRLVSVVFSVAVYGTTGYFVLYTGTVEGAAGILVFFSFQRIVHSLRELSEQQREVQFYLASIGKYRRALKKDVPFVYNEGKTFDADDISITFDGVSHSVGEDGEEKLILRDVNLDIAVGERIGIVGPSGAGKSQLMSLLVRADDPVEGKILVSGEDLAQLNLETLLRYYGVIMQKSEPYEDTILGNVMFGVSHLDLPMLSFSDMCKADQAELMEKVRVALKKAGLDGDEFKNEILTNIGYKGTKLSGGQQQRLQIAGAHLKLSMSERRPRFVLADEPTASLDSLSEVTVMKYLDDLPERTTMCMVAHRLSTVEHMDRIVFVRPLDKCDDHTTQVTVHDSLYDLYQTEPLFRPLADHQKYTPKERMLVA